MPANDLSSVTTLLAKARGGSVDAKERLIAVVYPELKAIAAKLMRREGACSELQTTALVHEAWLRLFGGDPVAADNRAWFFFMVSRAMRQTLVDCARARLTIKRGALLPCVPPKEGEYAGSSEETALNRTIAIDAALERLALEDERAARVVEMRFFCDLTFSEIAQVLGMTERTISRDWRFARAWLKTHLSGEME